MDLLDNPVDFGVHRAIDAAVRREGPSLPMVPIYVPRQHDEQLRTIVQQAVGGASSAVVLVGDSSSGKSRTCWEAVMSLPHGWRLWRPISPSPPQALFDGLACVGPWTVVWLDDAHDYLLTTSAAALSEQVQNLNGRGLFDHIRSVRV
ncbi:hypothetical protein [Parafrankia sp. FMc2]|uniref:hypothetical protein n=1 Tax=Parafrankia sp. FMc2 TaxID=3233196 RepID=UPI0034D78F81